MEVKILNQQNIIKIDSTISGYDLLNKYYQGQDKVDIIAFQENDEIKHLSNSIKKDATVKFIYKHDLQGWKILNYSCALVLGFVIKKLYPKALITFASSTDDGFYLDFDYHDKLKQEHILKLSDELKKILQENISIDYYFKNSVEIKKDYQDNPFIQEFLSLKDINDHQGSYLIANKVKIISTEVALNNNNLIKHFQLLNITGAYFLSNEKNKQLQRITGICDWTKKGLEQRILELEKRKSYDHRILNKKFNIFMINNDDVGQGLPMFLPNGMIIKNTLQSYLREQEFKWDYQEVSTPVLGSVQLYKKSGHWDHYHENMFSPIEKEDEQLVLRPMTCPHHCMIYKSVPRSYRDLPLRLSEHALLYRYETSGALTGLERVRSMELTDSHIFVRSDQIKEEFKRCYFLIVEVLKTLNIKIDYFSLSLRDSDDKEKYYSDDSMWVHAENSLREVLNELKIEYKEMIGEAAFYGPKFDVQIKTPLGHEVTISTIQFDFLLPKKFDLSYTDNNNHNISPVIIHRGLIGTYERFIATLLEQTQGIFPLWLAPKQVVILPVANSKEILDYSKDIALQLKNNKIRAELLQEETLAKRIRFAHEQKTPYIIIVGKQEVENNKLTYHSYKEQKNNKIVSKEDFISMLQQIIAQKK